MFRKIALAACVAACLGTSAMAAETAAETAVAAQSIAVVNVPLIMNDIPQAKALRETMKKEFGPRQAELEKIETEGKALQQSLPTLKGDQQVDAQRKLAQMQADFQLKLRAFQEDQQKRGQEEERKLAILVQKAIDTIAKERGLQLVLNGKVAAVYVAPSIDLTQEVIDRVSKQANSADTKKAAKK